ncbi:MAG: STAS domain-containing protein [Magnetospirillum sp. WYHS-4]
MELRESNESGQVVVELNGRLDSNTCKPVEDRLVALLDGGTQALVLDFTGLEYISSAGLRVLLVTAKRMKAAQGRLSICAIRPEVREVFEISGFSKIFSIFPSRVEAVG